MKKLILLAVFLPGLLRAETGREAWLRYAPLPAGDGIKYGSLPATVVGLGDSIVIGKAREEMVRGIRGMLGRTLRLERALPKESAIVLGTIASLKSAALALTVPEIGKDGFWLATLSIRAKRCIVIVSQNERGVLYGVFAFLSKIARRQRIDELNEVQQPYTAVRWVDQWDNLDGTIERGYGGPSIFFENDSVRSDLGRVSEYGRLLASVGIQGCAINNVNANPRVIQDAFLPQLARVAEAFRPWGVQLSVSVDLSSPKRIGDQDTFDPLDPRVSGWWQKRVDAIYRLIPDFAGFVVKADSEGRPGPSSYGRTPADAANMLARTLKPHGGILFYRAFVYDHNLDWRNPMNDRAKAAFDIFHPLDGKFEDNVIIQIKHGPIDFQVREPVSPLFGGLRETGAAVELPVMQEYTGQQKHLCFLIPAWKEVLDLDLQANGPGTPVKDILAGKSFKTGTGGFVAVVNVGSDENWLGHPMGMANLYGFGRLAWNPDLSAGAIAEEWTHLTFGPDLKVSQTVTAMLLNSWNVYESYTGPLGAQTLTDILGSHFGPSVEASERNGWGQWHRADEKGIGMDRTVATGTGFAGQYAPPVSKLYESLNTTPDNLLLFFHHVPYGYRLHSGKTVIQHIYDSHYEGAERTEKFVSQWRSLQGLIDEQRFQEILAKLEFQAGHARVWRDAICNWFYKTSGIADSGNRVGRHPGRIEAEDMELQGYAPVNITPSENSSGGRAVQCMNAATCAAAFRFDRAAGWYDMDIEYFDQNNGESKFRVLVGDQVISEWVADNRLPAKRPGADSSSRKRIRGIALRPGDVIRIVGIPDKEEYAGLDFVEIRPSEDPSLRGARYAERYSEVFLKLLRGGLVFG
jgi:alpha-glucuronidase